MCTNHRSEEVLEIVVTVLEWKKRKARSLFKKNKAAKRVLFYSHCLLAGDLSGCVSAEHYMAATSLQFS